MGSLKQIHVVVLVISTTFLSACGGGGGGNSTPPPGPSPAFTISISPSTSQSNPLGVRIATSGGSITVGVTPQNGFTSTVGFSMSGLPTGVSATPTTWSLSGSQTQTVTIIGDSTASSGPAQVTISGVAGSVSSSANLFLRVDPFLSATIGPSGGTLAVTDPTSPLFGLEFDIPAGALAQPTNIEMNPLIDIRTSQIASVLAVLGWGVDLKPDGLQLNALATLRVPYPDSNGDGVIDGTNLTTPFFGIHTSDATANSWLLLPTTLDSSRRTLEAQIASFSPKRWSGTKWLGPAKYRIANSPTHRNATPSSVKESIERAVYAWAKHMGLAGITFTEVAPNQAADLEFRWDSFSFSPLSAASRRCLLTTIANPTVDFCLSTLGLTLPSFQTIYFNDDRSWTTDPTDISSENVEAVAIHEMGHMTAFPDGSHFALLVVEDCNQEPLQGNCNQYQPPVMAGRIRRQARFLNLFPADLVPLYHLYDISRATESAYVTNQNSKPDSMSVVQLSNNSVNSITLASGSSNGPQGIALVDDRGKAYVAVYDVGKAYTIDLNHNQLWPFLPPTQTGAGSDEIAVTPDGSRAFVTNFLGNSVSNIRLSDPRNDAPNLPLGTGVTNLPITAPNGVAVTPDGNKILVTSLTGNLAIIDLASNSESSIPLGQKLEAVAIEPNGRFVYAVDAGSNQVDAVDLCPQRDGTTGDCKGSPVVIPPVQLGANHNPLAITLLFDKRRSLHHAYVSNFLDSSISVIDLNTRTVVTQITGLVNPVGTALTPDGILLYAADFGANAVRIAHTTDNSLDPISIPVGTNPVGISITSHPIQAPFDFAVKSFSVDGNILGTRNPDGILDFFDDFSNGSLTQPPTSSLVFHQGITGADESGGFLNLRSVDGAEIVGDFLRDDAELIPPLTKGAGDSILTALFRPDTPQTGQAYCLGIRGATPSGPQAIEQTQVCVENATGGPVILAGDQAGTLGQCPVSLAGLSHITLRLTVRDSQNQVIPSYSVDTGNAFTTCGSNGTIFTQDTTFFAFVQGGAFVQGSFPVMSQAQASVSPSSLNPIWTSASTTTVTGEEPVPPPPPPPPAGPPR